MALLPLLLAACGGTVDTPPATPEEKCPEIALEHLARDWIRVTGSKGEPTHRFRVHQDGDRWSAWVVSGGFSKIDMAGVLRGADLQLTEVLDGDGEEAAWKRGERARKRLYVEPRKAQCALRVMEIAVEWKGGKEIEQQVGRYQEYLAFPADVNFTFRPCDEPLFFEAAAKDRAVADRQRAAGGAEFAVALSESLPVGTFTEVSEDGDPSCAYTMDLYFDDQPVEGGSGLPAGDVKGGWRHWIHSFYAPYSGNHGFEMYRYRTCGETRELIAVACIEGALG